MVNAVITEKEVKSGNYLIIPNILWVRACVYHDSWKSRSIQVLTAVTVHSA
jgi:hypothetical protein